MKWLMLEVNCEVEREGEGETAAKQFFVVGKLQKAVKKMVPGVFLFLFLFFVFVFVLICFGLFFFVFFSSLIPLLFHQTKKQEN